MLLHVCYMLLYIHVYIGGNPLWCSITFSFRTTFIRHFSYVICVLFLKVITLTVTLMAAPFIRRETRKF